MRRRNGRAVALFLLGLGSMLQVHLIGFVALSELYAYAAGPVFLMMDYEELRRHGFSKYFLFAGFLMLSSVMSNLLNGTYIANALKGFATCYTLFVGVVVLYHYLKDDILQYKWFLIGSMLSSIISVFVFQKGSAIVSGGEVLEGAAATEAVVGYSLFWASMISSVVSLPITCSYLQMPSFYMLIALPSLAAFSLFSAGGRSAFAIKIFSFALVFLGGKKLVTMRRFRKNFVLVVLAFGVLGGGVMAGYKALAKGGFLGEQQLKKYQAQTSRGDGFLAILMGGRADFFASLFAALDHPIKGFGAWPFDEKGYWGEFIKKYGTSEEMESYQRSVIGGRERLLPGHSQLMVGWTWNGIGGLIFWLYILYLYYKTFRYNLSVIPELFGYFALSLPGAMWGILFSPLDNRLNVSALFALCLFADAVARGKIGVFRRGKDLVKYIEYVGGR